MIYLIIGFALVGLAISGFLTYVGIDAVIQNKNERKKEKELPPSLYRVRCYSFVYKKEDTRNDVFLASLLYQSENKEKQTIN